MPCYHENRGEGQNVTHNILSMQLLRISACLLVWLLVGCIASPFPPTPTSQSIILRILNRATYIDQQLLEQFTAETNITIDYHTYNSSEEAYRLLTNSSQPFDLIVVSDVLVEQLRREERLAVLDQQQLSYVTHLDPVYRRIYLDPEYRFCVPYLWRVAGFGYKPTQTGRPITSWDDVFDPHYNDRLTVLDDDRATLGMILIKLGYSPNTSDPTAIGAARDWLRERAERISGFAADNGQDLLANESAEIVVEWSGDILQRAATDPDIQFEIPAEGSILATDSMCIPINARHRSAAEQFMNFILKPENSAMLAKTTYNSTPNRTAWSLLDPELQTLMQEYQSLENEGRLFRLVDVLPAVRELYRGAWREVQQ